AMSPGTNIGAATPINMQGPMDSTLARKATNDAAAFARTVAAQRGRNAVWAEEAVRHAVAASDSEAVALHVVDFEASTLAELLALADGRTWRRGDVRQTLHTKGLPVDRMEPGFGERLLGLLAAGGVLSRLLGSVILFEGGGGGPRLSWAVIAGATLSTTAFFLVIIGAGLRAQARPVTTGTGALVGRTALVTEAQPPGVRV